MFTTEIHLLTSSFPIKYENAENCFIKENMYCIMFSKEGKRYVHKYPFTNIFRIMEDYSQTRH